MIQNLQTVGPDDRHDCGTIESMASESTASVSTARVHEPELAERVHRETQHLPGEGRRRTQGPRARPCRRSGQRRGGQARSRKQAARDAGVALGHDAREDSRASGAALGAGRVPCCGSRHLSRGDARVGWRLRSPLWLSSAGKFFRSNAPRCGGRTASQRSALCCCMEQGTCAQTGGVRVSCRCGGASMRRGATGPGWCTCCHAIIARVVPHTRAAACRPKGARERQQKLRKAKSVYLPRRIICGR